MSFEERLKYDSEFSNHLRRSVQIDRMSAEELLALPVESIKNLSEDELGDAMEKIMHGSNHFTLDEQNRTITHPGWHNYLETAFTKSK